jgi:membrane-bound inhibitor of C-type lysozyme
MIKKSSQRPDAARATGLATSRWKWPCLIAAIASLGLSAPAFATEAQYTCSGGDHPTARFFSPASGAALGSVTLTFEAGRAITLPQVMSADGGRYAGNGVEFWIKGRSATLTRNGVSETCSAQ